MTTTQQLINSADSSQLAHKASRQWSARPDDQRYLSLADLHRAVETRRDRSRQEGVALDQSRLIPDGEDLILVDHKRDHVRGQLNHWSFGQLCQRVGAPAGYLRQLPSGLAAIPLQWSMENADNNDARLLLRDDGAAPNERIAAVTSDTYGRIWDAEVTGALMRHVDQTQWKVPSASYASRDPLRATTLYASDRDVFVFLVNESHPIEVRIHNRAPEQLFRGVMVWNSEVGSASLGIATFLYRYVCDNRIVWGMQDAKQLRVRHTSGAPHRFVAQVTPALRAYAEASVSEETQVIQRATEKEVAKDESATVKWLRDRGFTEGLAKASYQNAYREGLNPRSVWGLVQGATREAHETKHTTERVVIERTAGKLLDLVAQ
jgi:hypothetical protein